MNTKIKRLFGVVLIAFFVVQCKKNEVAPQEAIKKTYPELLQKTLITILKVAEDPNFRIFIRDACIKQEHGDYNIYLQEIIDHYKPDSKYKSFIESFQPIVNQIRNLSKGVEPLLFYPKAETYESLAKQNQRVQQLAPDVPVGVYQNTPNPDYSYPGYKLNSNGSPYFYLDVTEDYAWENDVWVFGIEENVSTANSVVSPEDTVNTGGPARVDGQAEYGGIIQITNLGAVEPWTQGKLELKIFVRTSTGSDLSIRAFGKWRRKHFRNEAWKDFNHFIANWSISNIGNYTYEKWIEEDGGNPTTYTWNFPPPPGGGASLSTTYQAKNEDDDLGAALIQFSDPTSTIYNITNANIKRRN